MLKKMSPKTSVWQPNLEYIYPQLNSACILHVIWGIPSTDSLPSAACAVGALRIPARIERKSTLVVWQPIFLPSANRFFFASCRVSGLILKVNLNIRNFLTMFTYIKFSQVWKSSHSRRYSFSSQTIIGRLSTQNNLPPRICVCTFRRLLLSVRFFFSLPFLLLHCTQFVSDLYCSLYSIDSKNNFCQLINQKVIKGKFLVKSSAYLCNFEK